MAPPAYWDLGHKSRSVTGTVSTVSKLMAAYVLCGSPFDGLDGVYTKSGKKTYTHWSKNFELAQNQSGSWVVVDARGETKYVYAESFDSTLGICDMKWKYQSVKIGGEWKVSKRMAFFPPGKQPHQPPPKRTPVGTQCGNSLCYFWCFTAFVVVHREQTLEKRRFGHFFPGHRRRTTYPPKKNGRSQWRREHVSGTPFPASSVPTVGCVRKGTGAIRRGCRLRRFRCCNRLER
jgi:hypothetical protein